MKKLLIFAATAALLTACGGEETKPKEADNSYVYENIDTPIVWTGVQKGSNFMEFYFSANAINDFTQMSKGITVWVDNSNLGLNSSVENFVFRDIDEGFNYSQTNVAEGTVTAFLSGENINVVMNVTFTNGKKLSLKFVGTANKVSEIDNPHYERELNREWAYNSDTTAIVRASLGRYYQSAGKFDDYRIALNAATPADPKKPELTQTNGLVWVYIPRSSVGTTIDLSQKSLVNDLWEINFFTKTGQRYTGDQEGTTRGDVASGTLKVEYFPNEYIHRMVFTLDCTFTDGKTLSVRYEGGSWDLDDVIVQAPVVPGEGSGSFIYANHSATPVTIGWAGILHSTAHNSYAIALCKDAAKNYGSVWQTTDNAVMINIPEELLNQPIDLSNQHTVSGRDVWYFAFNDYDRNDINFEGCEDPTVHATYGIGGNIAGGTLRVDKSADVFTITFDVTTKTSLNVAGSYTGTLTDLSNYGSSFNGVFWWQPY